MLKLSVESRLTKTVWQRIPGRQARNSKTPTTMTVSSRYRGTIFSADWMLTTGDAGCLWVTVHWVKVNNDIFIFHDKIFYFRQLFCACYIIRIGLVWYWINPFSVLLCWKNSSSCQQLICYIAQSWLILNVHICILLYKSIKISLNFSYQSSEEHAIALMEDFSQRQNNVDDWTE